MISFDAPTAPLGLILAAGEGKRMKSALPKCLHPVAGRAMVEHVADALHEAGIEEVALIIGHGGEAFQDAYGDRFQLVWQHDRRGTGHAVMQALPLIEDDADVVVATGDTPLVTAGTFEMLLNRHRDTQAAVTIGAVNCSDPGSYGRVKTTPTGEFEAIVEKKDATEEEAKISLINSGLYVFRGAALKKYLPLLTPNNAQGELYLTDVPRLAREAGETVAVIDFNDETVVHGVNDRRALAKAEAIWRERRVNELIESGVTLLDPKSLYIEAGVTVDPTAKILPNVMLCGRTTIGPGCVIGPNTRICSSEVGENTLVEFSTMDRATFGKDCRVGPFANIRPGTRAGDGVKIGDFVELKNAQLEEGVKVPHLTYVGDASIGARTNIGAAVIFCNWDGARKHRTEIGADAFIGSNSTLVAPLAIGSGAFVAAGSVITSDVPEGGGAFGRARQETKDGWAARFRAR